MPVVARPVIINGELKTTVMTETKLIEAKLHYTTVSHEQNRERNWETVKLKVDEHSISGPPPPEGTSVWYVAVRDERKAIVSSEIMIP